MTSYASPLAAALRKPIIPIIPVIPHASYARVTLYNVVNEGTDADPDKVKKREEVYFCDKPDIEYIIRTILEFEDASGGSRLNIGDWIVQWGLFRQCFGGTVRDNYDIAKTGKANSQAGWDHMLRDFIKIYMEDTDLPAQKLYLDQAKKPYDMTVKDLAQRLLYINKYMKYFPGQAMAEPYDEVQLKYMILMMCPTPWQIKFAETGKQLSDATYTYKQFVRYLTIQEDIGATQQQQQSPARGNQRYGRRKRDNQYDANPRSAQQPRRFNYLPQFQCPYHHGHLWGACFGNPQSSAFKPTYILPQGYPYQDRSGNPNPPRSAPPPARRDDRGPPPRGPPPRGNDRYPPARRNLGASFGQQQYRGNNNRDDRYRTPGNRNYQQGRRQDQHMHDDNYPEDPSYQYDSQEQQYDDQYYGGTQGQDQHYHDQQYQDDRLRQDHNDSRSQRQDNSSSQDQGQDQDSHWIHNIQW